MDKTSIINNIQNKILIKNFSEWNHESIDNLLLIFRYPDCSEYYEDVLSLFKEYLQWRREGKDFNNENNYSTKKLIAVYLKLEELLLNNHYIYYEDIYDTLHNHSVQDLISEYSHLFLPIFCFFMVFVRILTFVPRKHNIKYDYNYDYNNEDYPSDCENATIDYIHKPLYIVIWEKTEKAYKLIAEMEKQGLHTVFIPEDELAIVKITDESMPMVYKEEVLLESWMDIYAEMYPM
jgi:hypothetical protein